MALVIENGSLVSGANSYVTVEEARAYAAARASILPEDDAKVEAALIVANDYLESLGSKYKGKKVDPATQSLQWPRKCVVIDEWEVPQTTIPRQLKDAQCQLAIESAAGTDLMPTSDGREVIREKVDVIETEYAAGVGGAPQPIFARANALLASLLSGSSSAIVNVIRA